MKGLPVICLAAVLLSTGCKSVVKYPGTGVWGANVKTLGQVTADSGKWPLSLNVPPPEQTYYSALRTKASSQFSVPVEDVVLGEVSVDFMSEVVGTIRSWKASAIAGQKTNEP